MGVATVLMGLLPTYQAIGVAAPIILIILRLVQGLGIGGEWGGAVLLAVEFSPKEKGDSTVPSRKWESQSGCF